MIKRIMLLCVGICFVSTCVSAKEKEPVCTKIWGGLGNNMFQYAGGFAYAKKHNKELELAGLTNQMKVFFNPPFKKVSTCTPADRNIISFSEKAVLDFSVVMKRPDYNYLSGYFQNEDVFKVYRKELLEIFSFKKELVGKNKELADKIKAQNSVGVHIRRGDYLKVFKNDVLSNHYYIEAMNYIATKVKNPHFYIFSDDIEWVKNNLKIKYKHTFVDNNKGADSANDMHLMSLCKHNIVANSTFSWWGAWLNKNPNKIIIAPSVWLSGKRHYETTKNIIPKNWVRIPSKATVAVIVSSDGLSQDEFEKRLKQSEFFLMPQDKKTYFMKTNQRQSITDFVKTKKNELKKFDYVFILKKVPLLIKEVNYSFLPDKNAMAFFQYDEKSGDFNATSHRNEDLLIFKGKDIGLIK